MYNVTVLPRSLGHCLEMFSVTLPLHFLTCLYNSCKKTPSNSDENFVLYAPKRSINACRPLCTGHVLLVRLWTQLECVARFQQHSVIRNFIKPRSEVWGQTDIARLYVVTSRCELLKEWEWKEQKKTGLKISSMVLKRLPPFCSFSGKSCILFRCFLKWLNWDHFERHVPLFT